MLTKTQLDELCHVLALTLEAREIVNLVRSSEPSRRVGQSAGNVSARFPSRKMGCVIQAESHRVELAAIHVMEYDPAILEYYDQPPRIPLHYRSPNDRAVTVQHTPDFFVIGRTWVGWEEWKTAARLVQLTDQMPGRYVREDQAGRTAWRCPPGETYARQVGLAYRVRCDEEINWTLQRNIQFLMDYWGDDVEPVDARTVKRVNGWIDDSGGTRLVDVLRLAREHDLNPDVIYTLIAQDYWYVDLQAAPLAQPDRVLVRRERSSEHPESGAQIPDAIIGDTGTASAAAKMSTLTPPARQILESASPRDLAIANGRWRILEPVLRGETHPVASQEVPERTLYRWRRDYYDAERQYGVGYVGLIPHVSQQGNYMRKLPPEVVDLMEQVIREHYETAKRRSAQSVYGTLVQQCDKRGWTAPSYKTFLEAVHRRPADQQIRQREGKRAAYSTTPFYWELSLTTPRHGDRIFEVGHVDHTQLDIELVCSVTGRVLGRPWLTLLMDAFSRRVLALWLSFERPSYRACMMILRECVRRHHRLPQTLVVDGGKEFESIYFETLLAHYGCTKKTRPGAQPRFGSVCERLFGVTNTQLVYNLAGNTQNTKQPRRTARSHDPRRLARWTLAQFDALLQQWAFEVYDTRDHPALGQSPREAFAVSGQTAGSRAHREIAYDVDFIIQTLPTTRKGTARVHVTHGVMLNNIYYWCEAFRDPSVVEQAVPVRYDPFDVGVAYAYVRGGWKRCISDHFAQLQGRSEREIALISEELRKRHHRSAAQGRVTSARIAQFIDAAEEQEVILAQRLRDAEVRQNLPPAPPLSGEDGAAGALPSRAPAAPERSRDAKPEPTLYADF